MAFRLRVVVLQACLACAVPAAGEGQGVQGRVLDATTEHPVPGALVELLPEARESAVGTQLADETGTFSLQVRHAGTYRLRVSRLGYQTIVTPSFDLVVGDELLHVELLIGADAIPLAPLVVLSARSARVGPLRLHTVGYAERRATWGRQGMGFGHFLDESDLSLPHVVYVTDALRSLPGVRVEGGGARRQVVTLRNVGPTGQRCIPVVYVDGAAVATGADINDVVTPADIVGIEIYPGQTGPPEFLRGRGCGAIAVWTGARHRRPDGS